MQLDNSLKFLEKEKRTELETFLNELGIIDRSSLSEKDFSKIMEEKKIILPRYLQQTSTSKDDPKKTNMEGETTLQASNTDEEPGKKSRKVDEEAGEKFVKTDESSKNWLKTGQARPRSVLTEKELNDKCCRLLLNTLPKELAEEYIKEYQHSSKKTDVFDENSFGRRRKNKTEKDASKSRKVLHLSFRLPIFY